MWRADRHVNVLADDLAVFPAARETTGCAGGKRQMNENGSVLMGTSFVVSAYIQAVPKYDAIQAGHLLGYARRSRPRLGGHRGP
jgi:hypothetical protein